MTTKDFCFWLQGFAELQTDPTVPPTEEQWRQIRNHLNLVFRHDIDPSMPDADGTLQATHDGTPVPADPEAIGHHPSQFPHFKPGDRC